MSSRYIYIYITLLFSFPSVFLPSGALWPLECYHILPVMRVWGQQHQRNDSNIAMAMAIWTNTGAWSKESVVVVVVVGERDHYIIIITIVSTNANTQHNPTVIWEDTATVQHPAFFFYTAAHNKARRVAGVMTPKRRKEGRKNAKRPWASPRLATEPPSSISMRNQYIIHYIVIPRETPQQPPHGKWDRIWYDDDWHIYIYMCVYAHHHYCVLCCVVLVGAWLIDWLMMWWISHVVCIISGINVPHTDIAMNNMHYYPKPQQGWMICIYVYILPGGDALLWVLWDVL